MKFVPLVVVIAVLVVGAALFASNELAAKSMTKPPDTSTLSSR